MSSSIPSWQISTAHAQPFRGARDLAFCLKVPLDSLLVWASSEGSGETARMRRLAWTFAARIGDKYQIRLTRSNCNALGGSGCSPCGQAVRRTGPGEMYKLFILLIVVGSSPTKVHGVISYLKSFQCTSHSKPLHPTQTSVLGDRTDPY